MRGSGMVRMAFQRVKMDPIRQRKPGPRKNYYNLPEGRKMEKREKTGNNIIEQKQGLIQFRQAFLRTITVFIRREE